MTRVNSTIPGRPQLRAVSVPRTSAAMTPTGSRRRKGAATATHLKSPWRRRSCLERVFGVALLSVLAVQIAPAVRLGGDTGASEFRLPGNHSVNLTHVILNPLTDHLFAGATNVVMEFDENLTLVRSVATGPEPDHDHCPPTNCNGTGYKTRPTNTINKVLLIDDESRKLIVCGSTHQGACQRMELSDITDKEPIVPVPVATNDENSSTFAMIGPAKYGDVQQRMLYVATTRTRYGTYGDHRPAISGRSLEPGDLFGILEHSFSTIARVDLGTTVKDYYLVSYVYGFHTDDFVYFATVQMRSHLLQLQELGYNSRLARLCAGDPSFNTYTEVSLVCQGQDGTDYNLLQDATLVEAGSDLARSLGLRDERRVLVGVFAQSADHTTKVSGRSAICIYPLRRIEKMFTENIHMCYNGTVATRNMDYVAGSLANCPAPGARRRRHQTPATLSGPNDLAMATFKGFARILAPQTRQRRVWTHSIGHGKMRENFDTPFELLLLLRLGRKKRRSKSFPFPRQG
ncbi:plexin-B-like [Tropilaelaps mercedesae]|uniref:Plexin-B-like n=1 Tax=Tropilaelaps mercedesae TaxID=418985 RepID=A0A1V9X451_9ACAR|nr:plexin-B-like [Tropilaelaps mercedesae]